MLKKIALAAMIGAALISVAGCGSSLIRSPTERFWLKNVTIGFSVSTQNNPFFVTMANNVKAAADKAGGNGKIVDAQNDHTQSRLMISQICSRATSAYSS